MRQILLPFGADTSNDVPIAAAGHLAARTNASITAMFYPRLPDPVIAVSYTHLTLPTICSV